MDSQNEASDSKRNPLADISNQLIRSDYSVKQNHENIDDLLCSPLKTSIKTTSEIGGSLFGNNNNTLLTNNNELHLYTQEESDSLNSIEMLWDQDSPTNLIDNITPPHGHEIKVFDFSPSIDLTELENQTLNVNENDINIMTNNMTIDINNNFDNDIDNNITDNTQINRIINNENDCNIDTTWNILKDKQNENKNITQTTNQVGFSNKHEQMHSNQIQMPTQIPPQNHNQTQNQTFIPQSHNQQQHLQQPTTQYQHQHQHMQNIQHIRPQFFSPQYGYEQSIHPNHHANTQMQPTWMNQVQAQQFARYQQVMYQQQLMLAQQHQQHLVMQTQPHHQQHQQHQQQQQLQMIGGNVESKIVPLSTVASTLTPQIVTPIMTPPPSSLQSINVCGNVNIGDETNMLYHNLSQNEKRLIQQLNDEEQNLVETLNNISNLSGQVNDAKNQCDKQLNELFCKARETLDKRRKTLEKSISNECERYSTKLSDERQKMLSLYHSCVVGRKKIENVLVDCHDKQIKTNNINLLQQKTENENKNEIEVQTEIIDKEHETETDSENYEVEEGITKDKDDSISETSISSDLNNNNIKKSTRKRRRRKKNKTQLQSKNNFHLEREAQINQIVNNITDLRDNSNKESKLNDLNNSSEFDMKFVGDTTQLVKEINNFGTIQSSNCETDITPQHIRIECLAWNILKIEWDMISSEKERVSSYGVCYREKQQKLPSSQSQHYQYQNNNHKNMNNTTHNNHNNNNNTMSQDWCKIEVSNCDHYAILKNLKPYIIYEIFVYARSSINGIESHSSIYNGQCKGAFIVGMSANSIHIYDIIRDEWKRLASMDGLDLFKPGLIIDTNQCNLIRVGGEKKFCHFSQLHIMNLPTLECRTLPSMKIKRACCQPVFVPTINHHNNYNHNNHHNHSMIKSSNNWNHYNYNMNMNINMNIYNDNQNEHTKGSGIGVDNYDELIVLGGCDRLKSLFDVEKYSFTSQKWTRLSPMITPRGSFATCVVNLSSIDLYNNMNNNNNGQNNQNNNKNNEYRLYVAGGFGRIGSLKACEVFDLNRNIWHPIASMHYARRGCSGINWNNKFVVIGGQDNGAGNTGEIYNPITNEWNILPTLNTYHYRPCISIYNNTLIVAGNNLQFDCYEIFNEKQHKWTLHPIKDSKKLRAAACYGISL